MTKEAEDYVRTWDEVSAVCSVITDSLLTRGSTTDEIRSLNSFVCSLFQAGKTMAAFACIATVYVFLALDCEFIFNTVAESPVLVTAFVDEFTEAMPELLDEYEESLKEKQRKKAKKWRKAK